MKFEILKKDKTTNARNGILHLPHSEVLTPVFMPVGTIGDVKAIYHSKIEEIGYKLILGNTYHLYLQPGRDVLMAYDGLHNFSSWNYNILTDSGGFQVFSLAKLRKITNEGVRFHSHIDGSVHFFTPESVVDYEGVIGSDIAMCLDVCTEPKLNYKKSVEAMEITHRWAERSVKRFCENKESGEKNPYNLFGIVQGNFYEDLRIKSSAFISSLPFDGIAIGGLSVGEDSDTFKRFLKISAESCTFEKPRYVMGIGTPEYMFEAVENGIDMFDCVLPTRIARHAAVFTFDGLINISKSQYALDKGPIVDGCRCTCCQRYSRAYLRHLFKAGESLAGMLATEHNLTFFYDLLVKIRESIANDNFASFKDEFLYRFSKKK